MQKPEKLKTMALLYGSKRDITSRRRQKQPSCNYFLWLREKWHQSRMMSGDGEKKT